MTLALSHPEDGSGLGSIIRGPSLGERALKRGLDIVGATVLLVVLAPFMIAIAIVIRATSRGPSLFQQIRVGANERTFRMMKFRTMSFGCSSVPHERYVRALLTGRVDTNSGMFKLADDPRITRVGDWLRRTSLDELPQLLNVLVGQMSLVGPRPVLPYEAPLLRGEQRLRFAVRPGMTGLWQVSGRNRLDFVEQLSLDAHYVRNQSFVLDLKILMRTLPAVLTRETR
jgi:lipopolysaccharide/colanic/teichoic acid biosynthesis glycosyltransferase